MVQMGRREWKVGRVAALNHREPSWPANHIAPYLVELSEGGMVYAPQDDPRLIREASKDDIARLRKADELTQIFVKTDQLGKYRDQLLASELCSIDLL